MKPGYAVVEYIECDGKHYKSYISRDIHEFLFLKLQYISGGGIRFFREDLRIAFPDTCDRIEFPERSESPG